MLALLPCGFNFQCTSAVIGHQTVDSKQQTNHSLRSNAQWQLGLLRATQLTRYSLVPSERRNWSEGRPVGLSATEASNTTTFKPCRINGLHP